MAVDPLHGGDIRKRPASAAVHDVQLEPGNVVRRRAGRVADRLAGHGAAIPMLPGWPGVMAANRLVIDKEGRDRLAEHPGELALVSGLTLIDLRTLGMECRDDIIARCGNGRWHLRQCAI